MLDICVNCPLYQYRNGLTTYVPGTDNLASRYALISEAPGETEVLRRSPFVGQAGQEQNQYLARANLSRNLFHIRNIVQCHPPGNRDPRLDEIIQCSHFLHTYLAENRPEIIGAVGRFAARWFLGDDLSMEYSHGIPYTVEIAGYTPTVVPIYHPAAGIRATTLMTLIRQDYESLSRAIRRECTPRQWPSTVIKVNAVDFPHFPGENPRVIAVDTETLPDGSPWCVTYCLDSSIYRGRIVMASDHDNLSKFNTMVNRPGITTVLHNALFDLGVLSAMGIHPPVVHDTMVMAYLLQDVPLGLKPLSYRLIDMTMRKYIEVISEAQQYKALEYLLKVVELVWDNPEAVLVWDKGYPKVKQPQNIARKAIKLLKKYSEEPSVDLYAKWKAIDIDGGKGQVEESSLGPMPEASLSDIPFAEALQYACADAVATYKIYPILHKRITDMGLWDTFNRDMRMLPMITDMMSEGILINKQHLDTLNADYETKRLEVEYQINDLYPGDERLNPGSTQQVARALHYLGVLPTPTTSTDSKTLDLYRDKHPIVNLITRWRELGKLQSTYLKPLPQKADANDRIHSKFSNTTTVTGRLASSRPNLQNIPTRTEEGRQIRHAFIAPPGCSLVSLDYSQIEMRCMAHVADDRIMIEMFMADLDIHSETAARMWKIPVNQVDKAKHRRPAKSVGFGVAYGIGPLGLQAQMKAQGVDYSERECQDLIASWYGVYPGIYEYMDRVRAEARRNGLVKDYFGRYRLVPEVVSLLPRVVNAGLRQAGNFPIQSMAQQIIKQAMGDLTPIVKELQEGRRYRCHPLLQIHDELVFEVSNELVDLAVVVIQSIMESAVRLVMPTPVNSNVGQTWGELK